MRETARRLSAPYRAQRVFVRVMLSMLERLIVAGSEVDPVIRAELASFPEGCTIGFSILGETRTLRVRVQAGRLVPARDRDRRPDLEVVFKHVAHAFALLSLTESSATAYARDRMTTHGDVALTMRFMRCADRVQGVMLPPLLAARALKSVPELPLGTRIGLRARVLGALTKGLFSRRSA